MSSNRVPAPITQAQRNEINGWLREKLKEYNDRDHAAINRHIKTLREALEYGTDDVIPTLFGGSVHKHTYVDGLSDVDVLMVINNSKLTSQAPKNAIEYMRAQVRRRLPKTKVSSGDLAVTVKFADGMEIQILPAIRRKTGVRIADPTRNQWSNVIYPDRFAAKLTKVNQAKGGRVIPVIKLAKGLAARVIRNDGEKIQGYHMESIAIQAFRNYQKKTDLRSMLIHFCESATEIVLEPIKDSSEQTVNADEYMKGARSPKRARASKNFRKMLNRFSACRSRRDLERLFG